MRGGLVGGRGDVSTDEDKPNVVIEMVVSAFVPNCRQEISDGLDDILFYDILLNWISTIMTTSLYVKAEISRVENLDNNNITRTKLCCTRIGS